MDRQALANSIVKAVRAEFGTGAALTLVGDAVARSEVTEVIPSGISVLDHYVMGVGGYPVGRMVELYSEEGAGKTSLVLAALASVQREGGVGALIETEDAFAVDRAETFGVEKSELVICQPDCMEDALAQMQTIMAAAKGKGPILIAWDSIAATPTRDELDNGLDPEKSFDIRAKLLSRSCRQLLGMAVKSRTCLLFVNQVREKIGVMFGDKYTTPGGKAVKFAASIRLQLFGGKAVKRGEAHVGKDITILAAKNKLAPPWCKARIRLRYDSGWDEIWSLLEHAKDDDLVEQDAKGLDAYQQAMEALGWPKMNYDVASKPGIEKPDEPPKADGEAAAALPPEQQAEAEAEAEQATE